MLEEINEEKLTRTRTYANQTRNMQVLPNGEISYTPWVNIKTWTKIDKKIVKEEIEEKRKINEVSTKVFRRPRSRNPLYDHTNVTKTYEDRKRTVFIDYDGNVSYGEWFQIRTYSETIAIRE